MNRFLDLFFSKKTIPHRFEIAIFQPDACRSIVDLSLGYAHTLDLEGDYKFNYWFISGKGTRESIEQSALALVQSGADLILSYGNACTQAAAKANARTKKPIPIVFTGVSNPVKLGNTLEAPQTYATGVLSFDYNYQERITHLEKLLPSAKNILVIHGPAHDQYEEIREKNLIMRSLYSQGIQSTSIAIETKESFNTLVPSAIQDVKPDVIFATRDPLIMANIEKLIENAREFRIPLYASDEASVKTGAAFGCGHFEAPIGKLAAQPTLAILKSGFSPSQIPVVQYKEPYCLFINLATMQEQGLTLSEEAIQWFHSHGGVFVG